MYVWCTTVHVATTQKNFYYYYYYYQFYFKVGFSYKTTDYNNIAIDKKQKVVVKGAGGKFIKGQLVSKNEKTMILENKEGFF